MIRHEKNTKVLGIVDGTFIIECKKDPDNGFLSFWCVFCKREHTHREGNGHRTCHCDPHLDTPFFEKGYILRAEKDKI